MERIQYRAVYSGLYFTLITSIIAVFTLDGITPSGILAILFWSLLYAVGLMAGWHHRERQGQELKGLSYIIAILGISLFISFLFISGIEKALIWFLITIQMAQNLTLSKRREIYYALFISLCLILYASSKSKDVFFVIYLVVYVFSGIFTLMASYMDERMHMARGGDRVILERRMNIPVKGMGVVFMTLCAGLLIYLFFPRLPSPHIQAFPSAGWYYTDDDWEGEADNKDRGEDAGSGGEGMGISGRERRDSDASGIDYGGFQRRFDITRVGRCAFSNDRVFYLHSDRPLYVRGKIFTHFDGRQWSISGIRAQKIISDEGRFKFKDPSDIEGVNQIYTIEKDLPPVIFAAYRPAVLQFPARVIKKDDTFSMAIPAILRKGTVYSVLSEIREIRGRPSGGNEGYTGDEVYLQLPPSIPDRVKALGGYLTRGIDDDYKKAEAIEDYLINNYRYTLDTLLRELGDDPVDEFLFETKEGHCELFATSMAIMLRSVGVPSRLATGFFVSRYNPVTGYYEVKMMDAHAWVEAYIDGYGWVTFEPTPGFDLLAIGGRKTIAFTGITEYMNRLLIDRNIADPEGWWARFYALLNRLKDAVRRVFYEIKGLLLHIWAWIVDKWIILITMLAMIGAIFFVAGRYMRPFYSRFRLRRQRGGDPAGFIIKCYLEAERVLARRGCPRPMHYTPSEYREMIKERFGHLSGQIDTITDLFLYARYSPFTPGHEDAERAYRAFEEILNPGPLKG